MKLDMLDRRAMMRVLPLAATVCLPWPGSAAEYFDPMFGRLRNRYILFRPGETSFEAAGIVDSNPINKGVAERGLTNLGREQVQRSIEALRGRGVDAPTIWYDNGARATQTADQIGRELSIPRANIQPEFRWLEARGLGALDGSTVSGRCGPVQTCIAPLSSSGERASNLTALRSSCHSCVRRR